MEAFLKQIDRDPIKKEKIIKPLIHGGRNKTSLRWIQNILFDEMTKEGHTTDIEIIPCNEEQVCALKTPSFTNFLEELEFLPPNEGHENWRIPGSFSKSHLQALHDYFLFQDEKCKVCNLWYKSLIQHIKKNSSCGPQYKENEMEELRLRAITLTKKNKKTWAKENKDQAKASNDNYYQANKAKKAAYYQKNKEEIGKKMAQYHNKNYKSIAKRKGISYFEKKLERAEKKKKTESGEENEGEGSKSDNEESGTSQNYSFKRKPVDFSMADLEAAAEEEEDEFRATIEPVEKKTLPERKCANKVSSDD